MQQQRGGFAKIGPFPFCATPEGPVAALTFLAEMHLSRGRYSGNGEVPGVSAFSLFYVTCADQLELGALGAVARFNSYTPKREKTCYGSFANLYATVPPFLESSGKICCEFLPSF